MINPRPLTPPYVPFGIRRFTKLDEFDDNVRLYSLGPGYANRHYPGHYLMLETYASILCGCWPVYGQPSQVSLRPAVPGIGFELAYWEVKPNAWTAFFESKITYLFSSSNITTMSITNKIIPCGNLWTFFI